MSGSRTRHRTWTTGELREVARLAGSVPEREILERLGLTSGQLRYAVRVLRGMGSDVSTRYYERRLVTCPSCGCARTRLGRDGVCGPCALRRQLGRIERDTAELLRQLPAEQREVYGRTESLRSSRADQMPRKRSTDGLGPYECAKAEEEYDAAMEAWLSTWLRRRVRAAQKRKERIRRKAEGSRAAGEAS